MAVLQSPSLKEHLRRLTTLDGASESCRHESRAETAPRSPAGGTPPPAAGPPSASKSAKRKAAEALIAARFMRTDSSSSLLGAPPSAATAAAAAEGGSPGGVVQRPPRAPVLVPACSACTGAAPTAGWCAGDVSIPPVDWPSVLRGLEDGCELEEAAPTGGGVFVLPGGMRVHIVSRAEQMPDALRALRASMLDGCVAIDLEWRPDFAPGSSSQVALMQLASATTCLLVRTSHMRFALHKSLQLFLSDPAVKLVGYGWDSADEHKMQSSFGFGRAQFGDFQDLQAVSEALGYHGYGLAALTERVLGFTPPKCRKVAMSNWEARQLSPRQIQYAALDALICGHLYRGLRLWHVSPSACTACDQLLGTVVEPADWKCRDCERTFSCFSAINSHVRSKNHECRQKKCDKCGRFTLKL